MSSVYSIRQDMEGWRATSLAFLWKIVKSIDEPYLPSPCLASHMDRAAACVYADPYNSPIFVACESIREVQPRLLTAEKKFSTGSADSSSPHAIPIESIITRSMSCSATSSLTESMSDSSRWYMRLYLTLDGVSMPRPLWILFSLFAMLC